MSKNPVDEYFETKEAGFGRSFANEVGNALRPGNLGMAAGRGAVNAGFAAAGAGAVAGAAMGAQKLYDAATKARDFRAMLEADGRLAQLHQENPRLVNQMFSTLRSFNPSFTRDPIVASHYVFQMAETPTHAGSVAVSSLDYRDKAKNPLADKVIGSALHRVDKK